MLRPARVAAVVSVLAFAALPLHAQDLVALCKQIANPPVGAWSSYRFVGGQEDGGTLKISVVGSESHGDTAYKWVEMAMNGFKGSHGENFSGVSKILVASFGPGMGHPRSMVMKFGTAPAMVMPTSGPMANLGGDKTGIEKCGQGKSLGWESVTVPGGTFRALHVQDENGSGDVWVVPSLPLGLVKMHSGHDNTGEMVLTDHGTGAKDAITETPVPFNMQVLMQVMGGQNSH